jgi:serine/threonine-protein kinase
MQDAAGPDALESTGKFGPYDTTAQIAKTELGVDFLARDRRDGSEAVLRTMRLSSYPADRGQAAVRRRLRREAEACAALDHPSILRVLATGEEEGLRWIAYERFEGVCLTEHVLAHTLLPVTAVLELAAGVADALDHAHGHGVVHRDLRPASLLYRPATAAVKVKDFGLAQVTDTQLTRTGLMLGTPSYKSPEQLAADPLTPATDQYSLGVTVYQLLTGHLPFEGASMIALMHSIVRQPHRPPSTVRTGLPPALDATLARALTKAPQGRFRRAADMARALRACAGAVAA